MLFKDIVGRYGKGPLRTPLISNTHNPLNLWTCGGLVAKRENPWISSRFHYLKYWMWFDLEINTSL